MTTTTSNGPAAAWIVSTTFGGAGGGTAQEGTPTVRQDLASNVSSKPPNAWNCSYHSTASSVESPTTNTSSGGTTAGVTLVEVSGREGAVPPAGTEVAVVTAG